MQHQRPCAALDAGSGRLRSLGTMGFAKCNLFSEHLRGKQIESFDKSKINLICDRDMCVTCEAWPCHTAGLDTIFVQIYMDPPPGVPGVSKDAPGSTKHAI